MLGKLFSLTGAVAGSPSSAPSASQKHISSLESVQEDIHTRNLLFPDAQALYQHRHDQVYPLSSGSALPATSATNAFDYSSDIELETRDVRVIIMQDALGSVSASLLYDSQAPPQYPASSIDRPSTMAGTAQFAFQDPRRTPSSARKPSLTHAQRPVIVQPDSPQLRQGAFDRRPSVHNRNQSVVESESQRAWREYREDIATFSSCIFGNSELMAYKGTSTKVHVVPSEPRPSDYAVTVIGDGRGSVGRASLRSSRLSQSFTSEHIGPFNMPPTPSSVPRPPERKKVLITRLFPVNVPVDDEPVATPQSRFSEDSTGFPFPMAGDDLNKKKKPPPKQKRTPMYAVALVISLPQSSPPISSATVPRPGFRGPSSYTEQDSFCSSFSSTRRSGWTMVGHGGGGYGLDSFESAFTTDMEDRMDAITQHWDIVMRTLTHLQSIVATTLVTMLKQVDLTSPDPLPAVGRTSSVSARRSEDTSGVKPPKTNAKHLTLLPSCLAENRYICVEVDNARTRIVTGLRVTRVVTGQNRWGIWREEARWVARWAGGKEQGFFFFNLLTGFLATHTDWLQALAPSSYRKRHFLQQRSKGEEDASVPARTVIVANDKMAARRLVFLLSAFLPANQQLPSLVTHRPSTSASLGAFSQSPPSFVVPILKEESLRRKINRRPGPRRVSHSRTVSLQGQARPAGVPAPLAHLSMEGRHERRSSDATSVKTANLPIPVGDPGARKSSAVTTATITPETSIPHFSTAHRSDTFSPGRPGSSSSVAADDLKRLTREDSTGQYSLSSNDSRHGSRWGSVISGLWNARRRESASSTLDAGGTMASRDSGRSSPTKSVPKKAERHSKVVSETQVEESSVREQNQEVISSLSGPEGGNPATPRQPPENSQITPTRPEVSLKAQRTPDPSGAFESPVKTSINIDDGVIDVDVPFPEYLTSFETAVSSPSSSGFLSTPGFGSALDAFEQSSRASMDSDAQLNVAGWLQNYHSDFVLQAIPAQHDLVDEVKASLRAEPSPPLVSPPLGEDNAKRWVDVSSAIIADTTTFNIIRVRYRRLVKLKSAMEYGAPIPSSSYSAYHSALLTPAIAPYEVQLGEDFVTEQLFSLDEILTEAVEKVIALSTDVSKVSSTCSSRSTSKRRERSNSESTQSDEPSQLAAAPLAGPQEVPRGQCKTVVLSALEEIVREAVQQREREQGGSQSNDAAAERESPLRKAVRAWLESVDQGD